MEAREGVRAQGYEPRVMVGGERDHMAHTDSRIDYESRMAERIEQDYRLLDMACAVLYGRESGKGGVDALMGSAVADCISFRYVDARPWSEVAALLGYSRWSRRSLRDMCQRGFDFALIRMDLRESSRELEMLYELLSFTVRAVQRTPSERDDWETPRDVFERCNEVWHFELGRRIERRERTVRATLHTKKQDGLKQEWGGGYASGAIHHMAGKSESGSRRRGASRARTAQSSLCFFPPARTDTRWFHDYCTSADEVAFFSFSCRSPEVQHRLHGVEQSSAPFPSMLVRFGGALDGSGR